MFFLANQTVSQFATQRNDQSTTEMCTSLKKIMEDHWKF